MKIKDLDIDNLSKIILPFTTLPEDYSPLLADIGDAHLVLIGEASHGTHEFYKIRAEISKRLIEEKGFQAIAIEGDWPEVYNINTYIKGKDPSIDEYKALASFERFPSWMWCNYDVLKCIRWLRAYNDRLPTHLVKVGMYGLDLYSLHASISIVIQYLEKNDPEAAKRARERYQCLQEYGDEPTHYAYAVEKGLVPGCKEKVYSQLVELLQMEMRKWQEIGIDQEELLFLIQNAKIVVNAEAYYGALLKGPEVTWNLRDRHMMDTLESLRLYYQHILGIPPKIIIWAHNSHVGDARATQSAQRGEINIGQLAREKYKHDCYLIGFSTYTGEVTAASTWGGITQRKKVRPALQGSYEHAFRQLKAPNFLLFLNEESPLQQPRLQRAIGVIYRPETERMSHYYYSYLLQQFDALIHIDITSAVTPLYETHAWEKGELPETFPFGL
jgi:erythromycin esterase-like protein